jgi:hypothetical protein
MGRRAQLAVSTRQLFGLCTPRFYLRRLRRRYGPWLHERDQLWDWSGSSFPRWADHARSALGWRTGRRARPPSRGCSTIWSWLCRNAAATPRPQNSGVTCYPCHSTMTPCSGFSSGQRWTKPWMGNATQRQPVPPTPTQRATTPTIKASSPYSTSSSRSASRPSLPPRSVSAPEQHSLPSSRPIGRTAPCVAFFTRACQLIAKRRGSLWPRLWGYAKRHPCQTVVAWVVAVLVALFCFTRLAASP